MCVCVTGLSDKGEKQTIKILSSRQKVKIARQLTIFDINIIVVIIKENTNNRYKSDTNGYLRTKDY